MTLDKMTYAERLELRLLLNGPRRDFDTSTCRVLINSGLAERCGIGQMKIAEAGRQLASQFQA